MADQRASKFAFLFDLFRATLGLAFGRLFTKLEPPQKDLAGKVAIVTGANSGIGFQVALDLARQGATVYLACRNQSKANDAAADLVSKVPGSSNDVKTLSLDTSSMASIEALAKTWERIDSQIDILVHNAAIGATPAEQPFTTEGLPMVYYTNFLGSYILTRLLERFLADTARVVLTSSTGQYGGEFIENFSISPIKGRMEEGFHHPPAKVTEDMIYSNTKAMQVCFAKLLQERWDRIASSEGRIATRTAHAFTTGFTSTPIFDKITTKQAKEAPFYWWLQVSYTWLAINVSQGAATGVWLATTDDEEVVGPGSGGRYWERMSRRVSTANILPRETLDRLWIRWEADAGMEWR